MFLPIARRELRVAALKRSTPWVRLAGALVALLIGCLFFAIGLATTPGPALGRMLFGVLTSLAFMVGVSAGMFFTSDSLSEEKREGTLGFLFLTDLRGYDVVSGKLLAAGLRGFYMLLAAFPIVAVTLLMGGVTGAAFWRTCLALLNALFVSLVAGLFVSSISRESQSALLGTMMVLIFWGGAGYLIDQLSSQALFRFSSPLFTFTRATRAGSVFFWEALLINQVIAWGLLALACHFATRTWHDKPQTRTSTWATFTHWLKYGSIRRRARLRLRLMSVNPVTWLASRERWQAASCWVITLLLLAALTVIAAISPPARPQFWPFVAGSLALGLYLGFASHTCRFFAEARKNALLELLLSTPLSPRSLIEGQWKAVLRMFGPPTAVFVVTYFLGNFFTYQSAPGASPLASLGTSAAEVFVIPFDLACLAWLGMWMGLTSKSVNRAAWKTVLFGMLLPAFVVMVVTGLIVFLMTIQSFAAPQAWTDFVQSAVPAAGSLAIDWALYVFARRRLFSQLRQRAAAHR